VRAGAPRATAGRVETPPAVNADDRLLFVMSIRFVTLIGSNADVLPCLLAHYRERGVESFALNVHLADTADPVLDQVRIAAAEQGCEVGSVGVGHWQDFELPSWIASMRQYPNDWWVLADQDEFHHYPDRLQSLLSYCDRKGYDHIYGLLVDRIASDGYFPAIDYSRPLWPQFPLGCIFSAAVLRAYPMKVIAAKGYVEIGAGHHRVAKGVGCPIQDIFVQVHHFKWTAGVIERQRLRAATLRRNGVFFWEESARFMRYCETHDDHIDVSDTRLLAGRCDPGYAHWNALVEMMTARRGSRQAGARR
jgi:hypothetical protein